MTKQNILFIISCLLLSGCTLEPPCETDEYLDKDTQVCLKQTERNCGGQGSIDCLDKALYSQTNIKSWRCVDAKCQVDECLPNAEFSDDRLSCKCQSGFYYNQTKQSCMELNAESCGLNGEINCYDEKVNSQTNVKTWQCIDAKCQVETCSQNAEHSEDMQSCGCKEGYYYDSEQSLCLKLSGESCGDDGQTNCYVKYGTKDIAKWRCDLNTDNHYDCIVESCVSNASTSTNQKSCECAKGYFHDEANNTCVNSSGFACGTNGETNCYNISEPLVSSWKCEDSFCKVDSCKPNAQITDNHCQCKSGFYFNEEYQACMRLDAEHCGNNGKTNCYLQEGKSGLEKWNCEAVADESGSDWNYECKFSGCAKDSHQIESTNVCECNKKMEIQKSNGEAFCYRPSCIDKPDTCFFNQNCNSDGICEVKSCEERCNECRHNECLDTINYIGIEFKEPELCQEGIVFIRMYFKELLTFLDKIEDIDNISEVCNYYKQLSELYNSKEPVQEWCHSRPKCGAPSILMLCYGEVTDTMMSVIVNSDIIDIGDKSIDIATATKVITLFNNYNTFNCDELNSGDKPDD